MALQVEIIIGIIIIECGRRIEYGNIVVYPSL
jgi:hypothetical protein